MKKVRYELDPHNRIVAGLPAFRQVLDGEFRLDGDNNLSYHVKAPLARDSRVPHQIALKGSWSMTPDHRLRYTLDKQERRTFGDRIDLEGRILDAGANSILFALSTASADGKRTTYTLGLEGSWKADARNRLTFHVKREKGRSDILTFTGAWEVDKAHRIVYRYASSRLTKKSSRIHTVVFYGRWNITGASRISYVLSADTGSAFEFKAGPGVFRENYVKYGLSIGASGRVRPARRTITLGGEWNFDGKTGLKFEIGLERSTGAVMLSADIKVAGKNTVTVRLRSADGARDLGVTVELSRKIFKGEGEAFIRALESTGESALYAGAAWRW